MKEKYEPREFLWMTSQGRGNGKDKCSEMGACLYFEEQQGGQCGWNRLITAKYINIPGLVILCKDFSFYS